jgi:N-acetylneuraminic acid mutarotase
MSKRPLERVCPVPAADKRTKKPDCSSRKHEFASLEEDNIPRLLDSQFNVLAVIPVNHPQKIVVNGLQLWIDPTAVGLRMWTENTKDTEKENFAVTVSSAEAEVTKHQLDIAALEAGCKKITTLLESFDDRDVDSLATDLIPLLCQNIGRQKKQVKQLQDCQFVEIDFEETTKKKEIFLPVNQFVKVGGWFSQSVLYWHPPESVPKLSSTRTVETVRRTKTRLLEKLYILGGALSQKIRLFSLEQYDPKTGESKELAPMSTARSDCGCAFLDGYLYAVGGRSQLDCEYKCTVERYDVIKNQWKTVTSLLKCRSFLNIAALGGYLYAVGGIDDTGRVEPSVERFDPIMNQWEEVAQIPQTDYELVVQGVVVLNDCLFVVDESYKVQCYDPVRGVWKTSESKMDTPRYGFSVVVIDEYIYAVGGFDIDGASVNFLDRYDPTTECWEQMAAMSVPRAHTGTSVFGGCLYVFGGLACAPDSKTVLSCVEKYNPVENMWTSSAPMSSRRSSVAVVSSSSVSLPIH